MDNETAKDIQHRDAFVIYMPGRGFIKNKHKDFTTNFSDARLFSKNQHATNSINMGKWDGKAHVIPVRMTLDPKQIFTAVLKG